MKVIVATDIVKYHGGDLKILSGATLSVESGEKIGLVGRNGVGKTTLLEILAGNSEPDGGSVEHPGGAKVGMRGQKLYAGDRGSLSVEQEIISAFEPLMAREKELEELGARLSKEPSDALMERYGRLQSEFERDGGYEYRARAASTLSSLGFSPEDWKRPVGSFSGGEQSRIALARLLLEEPDLILLDEPTNHLDLDSIHWLEEFLTSYQGSLVVISHDRHFLNRVCTHIADIDYQTIITYTGGYDDMVIAKTQFRTRFEAQQVQREKKIAQLQEFIARFSAGTRSSQVTSRKKEVERLQTNDLARSNIQRPYIRFTMKRPHGRMALECEGVSKAYGDQQVLRNFGAFVERGEKIAVVGRNGAGKTTLLRALLAGESTIGGVNVPADARDSGTLRWGHEVSIGYFLQDQTGVIEPGWTAADWLHQFDPEKSREEIRGLLGQMLFAQEEGMKPTAALSGGETARLLFCRIMLLQPNLLVLDEPTNHLDLESVTALNIAIQKFEGTVLLVTHDEDLIEETATRIWHVTPRGVEDFKGTFEDYTASVK
jgi:ATPase subunit of ABC transporter with duplicated ATPase domains